jgi:hypothetical protein
MTQALNPRKFTKRTYGRIFVQKTEDIARVFGYGALMAWTNLTI